MYKYHHISTFLGCHPGLAMWFTGQRGGQKSPVLVINPCCVCVASNLKFLWEKNIFNVNFTTKNAGQIFD